MAKKSTPIEVDADLLRGLRALARERIALQERLQEMNRQVAEESHARGALEQRHRDLAERYRLGDIDAKAELEEVRDELHRARGFVQDGVEQARTKLELAIQHLAPELLAAEFLIAADLAAKLRPIASAAVQAVSEELAAALADFRDVRAGVGTRSLAEAARSHIAGLPQLAEAVANFRVEFGPSDTVVSWRPDGGRAWLREEGGQRILAELRERILRRGRAS